MERATGRDAISGNCKSKKLSTHARQYSILFIAGIVALAACFAGVMLVGAAKIPAGKVLDTILHPADSPTSLKVIVWETRFPMAMAAICSGAMLSVAGLLMQTLFRNPLAGPSVLGISSGASFGVALLMLGASGFGMVMAGWMQSAAVILASFAGGIVTILILYLFSTVFKSATTLLIVGLMLSYLFSSGISLLNYFSKADEIRSYLIWGLGSFSGLRLTSSIWLVCASFLTIIPIFLLIKPLNALLFGERYAESVGYSMPRLRGMILLAAGLLVAIPTAFCGPIGFIGLIVPHLARMLFKTSNHLVLLPACVLTGAVIALLCALMGVLPSSQFGVLPINIITPIIGVPVILFLLTNKTRKLYF